ncbi:putative member of EAF superfamily [Blumeria hordei DH14]|uniref:Putative member of EAF superfamily n=1 Tax=Blumeria graminis f. sp. hordei (strain DH14) TaxID=546991 RepID=N1JFN8_BLUG1|nr:putative member of EAF superfamily [Blumeria hordei DH14]
MTSMMNLGFGEYPIVLSDALLGRATNTQNTAIDSYSTIPRRLAPSGEKANSFSLSFPENSDNLSYQGERSSAQEQYILIFNADKEQFVLHRVDSNFDMKRVCSSSSKKPTGLRTQSSRYDSSTKHQPAALPKKSLKRALDAAADPVGQNAKKPRHRKQRDSSPESDEIEEESDDGLTIEFPGAQSPGNRQHEASPVDQRQLSEEDIDEEADIAPGDYQGSEQAAEDLKNPGPEANSSLEMSDEDMELALEAELEQELLKESANNVADESDESEEE